MSKKNSTNKKVASERLKIAHKSTIFSAPAAIICALLVYFGLSYKGSVPYLNEWLYFVIGISLLRYVEVAIYFYHPSQKSEYSFIFVNFLSSITWGILGYYFMPESTAMQMMIIVILAGISVGGVQSLQANLPACLIFCFFVTTPLCIWLFNHKTIEYVVLGSVMLTYLFFLFSSAYRAYLSLNHALSLQFENLDLVKNLSLSNKDLEASLKSIKKLVSDLEEAKNQANSANKIKSAFIANMSHELRTPLNAILGYSELLLEDEKKAKNEKHVSQITKVIGAGKHLLSLINDVLDLSKIEAGKMEVFLEKIEVNQTIKELSSIVDPLLKNNKNTLIINLQNNVKSMYTDQMKLRQCLLNLLSNANKFTKEGTIQLDISKFKKENRPFIQFSVKDSGIGISTEKFSKLFKVFSQVDSSISREFGGTGLGLYLTHNFCNMLGGNINAKSEIGKGSCFTIQLPQTSENHSKET